MLKRNIFVNAYNKTPRIGDSVMVHSYKYSGWLYRTWNYPIIVDETDEYLVVSTIETLVLSSEENSFRVFSSKVTKPSFWFFFKDKWFNLIVTVDRHGTKLYINIASPYIYEEGAIKYFDFDLDFKTIEGTVTKWKEIDINEYFVNRQKFRYPEVLTDKISTIEKEIEDLIDQKWFAKFANLNFLSELYKKHLQIINEREEKYNVPNSKD